MFGIFFIISIVILTGGFYLYEKIGFFGTVLYGISFIFMILIVKDIVDNFKAFTLLKPIELNTSTYIYLAFLIINNIIIFIKKKNEKECK